MSKWIFASAAAALLLAPLGAHALEPGSIDAYYIPNTNLDLSVPGSGGYDDDGDGFGIKGLLPLGALPNLAFTGEYESSSYDNGVDLDSYRLGAGWLFGEQVLTGGVFGEYVNYSLDDADVDGYGVHARLSGQAAERLNFYVQAGYLDLSGDDGLDIDGPEYLIGAAYQFTPQLGAFVDFRSTQLEDDNGIELDNNEVRTGLRYWFPM